MSMFRLKPSSKSPPNTYANFPNNRASTTAVRKSASMHGTGTDTDTDTPSRHSIERNDHHTPTSMSRSTHSHPNANPLLLELRRCIARMNAIIRFHAPPTPVNVPIPNVASGPSTSPLKARRLTRSSSGGSGKYTLNRSNHSSSSRGSSSSSNRLSPVRVSHATPTIPRTFTSARFVAFEPAHEEELVELLRRIAELVVQGEKRASRFTAPVPMSADDTGSPSPASDSSIFDYFCETSTLSSIVNIVTGAAFTNMTTNATQSGHAISKGLGTVGADRRGRGSKNGVLYLPPIAVATQAVQSVSILIQNVIRTTSLYFLLSNNRVNDLIGLPLNMYTIAEDMAARTGDDADFFGGGNTYNATAKTTKGSLKQTHTTKQPSPLKQPNTSTTHKQTSSPSPRPPSSSSQRPKRPKRPQSAEIAELSTHFISFLKSLAMRMNSETLQFFLSYPQGRPNSAGGVAKSKSNDDDDDDKGLESALSIVNSASSDVNNNDIDNVDGSDSSNVNDNIDGNVNDNDSSNVDDKDTTKKQTNTSGDENTDTTTTSENNSNYGHAHTQYQISDIKFPLYARALQFCAATEDPFIRVTAMNICFNILILATTTDADDVFDVDTPSKNLTPPNANTLTDHTTANSTDSTSPLQPTSSTKPKNIINGSLNNDGTVHLDSKQSSQQLPPEPPTTLQYKDRLAIAHYVCQPAHVQSLMTPIFTKLAQLCGVLEGLFRALDRTDTQLLGLLTGDPLQANITAMGSLPNDRKETRQGRAATPAGSVGNGSAAVPPTPRTQTRDLRRQRHIHTQSIQEVVADLQDEFLLLEDVLKVGLVRLNEQIIEMMMATLVYPVLLQPLCHFMLRCRGDSGGGGGKRGNGLEKEELTENNDKLTDKARSNSSSDGCTPFPSTEGDPDSSLAKMALFVFAITFELLSHRPLLHLILTALFHPMSPAEESSRNVLTDSQQLPISSSTFFKSGQDEATMITTSSYSSDEEELKTDPPTSFPPNRVEKIDLSGQRATEEYEEHEDDDPLLYYCYSFKTSQNSLQHPLEQDNVEQSIFVLSPALANLFHRTTASTTSTSYPPVRPNPYRRALLACLSGTDGMSTLQFPAVFTLDSMLRNESLHPRALDRVLLGGGVSPSWNEEGEDKYDIERSGSSFSSNTNPTSTKNDLKRSGMNTYLVEVIASMCVSVMAASVPVRGVWSLKFNEVASHAILYAAMINEDARLTASKLIDHRLRQSASFLSDIPSCLTNNNNQNRGTLGGANPVDENGSQSTMSTAKAPSPDDTHRQNVIMDRIFFDPFCDDDRCVVEHFFRRREKSTTTSATAKTGTTKGFWTSRGYVSVARESGIDDMVSFLCHDPTSVEILVGDDATYRCGANSAVAHLRLDSFSHLLKNDIGISNGLPRCSDVATLARYSDDMLEYNNTSAINDQNSYRSNIISDRTTRTYLKTVSPTFTDLLFEEQTSSASYSGSSLEIGSVVTLVGRTAFPCVCEVSKESDPLFADRGRCVVAEGVKWQSLYLVLLNNGNNDEGGHLVLAEPATGSSGGNGRVVTSCRLSCLNVDRDEQHVVDGTMVHSNDTSSSARRLLLTLYSPVPVAPGIFVADPQNSLPFDGNGSGGGRDNVRITRSSKDIWFEDSNSAEQAFKALCSKIAKARSKRGQNIRQFLSCTYLPSC